MTYTVQRIDRPAGHSVWRVGCGEYLARVDAEFVKFILNTTPRSMLIQAYDYAMKQALADEELEAAE